MFPNNGANMGPPLEMPVKKRRSRKKKPVAVDPEAERQERELRMKIKQSLHTQQVLRTEVEEEEAQKLNVTNVVSSQRQQQQVQQGGMGMAGQMNNCNMGNNQMNNMMMGGMGMGFNNNMQQQQMGGMGMQQNNQQQQQQYNQMNSQHQQQYNNFNHQNQNQSNNMNIQNIQQQMQQMKQQLEIQRQQIEQQMRVKQQMEQQQQQQQQYQYQQQGSGGSGNTNYSNEEIMRNLKNEQERLLAEARNRGDMNNMGSQMTSMQNQGNNNMNNMGGNMNAGQNQMNLINNNNMGGNTMNAPQSPALSSTPSTTGGYSRDNSSPMYMPNQYQQQDSNGSNNYQGSPHMQGMAGPGGNNIVNLLSPQPTPSPQMQLQQQQYQQGNTGMSGAGQSNHFQQQDSNNFNETPQVSNRSQNQQQIAMDDPAQFLSPPPYSRQVQADQQEQKQPYQQHSQQQQQSQSSQQQGNNQQSNGQQYNQQNAQQQESPATQPSLPSGRKKQGMRGSMDMSLFSSNSNASSWMKSSSINSSFGNSMAFHSVGNMSASFTSTIGNEDLRSSDASIAQVPKDVLLEDSGEGGGGGGVLTPVGGDGATRGDRSDSKNVADECNKGNTGSSPQAASQQRFKYQDSEAGHSSFSKGTYIETNIGLKPIQENEADDASNAGERKDRNNSSFMMSMLEGEFMGSNSSLNINDLAMSMDSTAFSSVLKQVQGGEDNMKMSIGDLAGNGDDDQGDAAAAAAPQKEDSAPSEAPKRGKPFNWGNQGHSQRTLRTENSGPTRQSSANESSLEDEQNNNNEAGPSSRVRSRRISTGSKISMMTEISQWTQNNPFEQNSSGSDSAVGGGGHSRRLSRQMQLQQLQGDYNGIDCPVDMGDFHSLGGSMANSLDLSMMSSMTGDGLGLSESLRALDLSIRDVERPDRKGK